MPVTYEVADDIGAQMILAGDDGFPAAPEVPFLSWSLNQIFFQLYQVAPLVPWYGILLVTTQALGLSLLAYCFVVQLPRVSWSGLWIPFFFVFAFQSLFTLTFTKAALTLEFSVFAVVLLQRLSNREMTRPRQWLLAGLLILALLWRWKLGLFCFVFAAPLLVFTNLNWLRKQALPLLVVLAFVGVDRGVNWLTRTPQWFQYMEFYSVRAELFDMPGGRVGKDLAQVAAAVGWESEDYELIRNYWMLHDERLANKDTFQKFLDAASASDRPSKWEQGVGHLRDNALLLYALLPLMLALILFQGSRWRDDENLQRKIWAGLLIALPLVFLTLFRMVPRVTMPTLFYTWTVLLIFIQAENSPQTKSRLTAKANPLQVMAMFLLALSGWHCFQLVGYQWVDAGTKRSAYLQSEQLVAGLPQPVTLLRMSPAALPGWEGCHPLQRINQDRSLRFLPAGWQIGSPRYKSILAELGYQDKTGSEMLRRWGQDVDSGEYFVRRLQRAPSAVEPISPIWLSYFRRWHPERSLTDVQSTLIKLGNGDQLSLIQLPTNVPPAADPDG